MTELIYFMVSVSVPVCMATISLGDSERPPEEMPGSGKISQSWSSDSLKCQHLSSQLKPEGDTQWDVPGPASSLGFLEGDSE